MLAFFVLKLKMWSLGWIPSLLMFPVFFCCDIIGKFFLKCIIYESEKNEMHFKDMYLIVEEV